MIKYFRYKGLHKFYKTGNKSSIQPKHAKRLRFQRLVVLVYRDDKAELHHNGFAFAKSLGRSAESWLQTAIYEKQGKKSIYRELSH